MDIISIITIIAGLVLFLYGMNVMGAGLENIAGKRMQAVIEKATSTPIKGVLVGLSVTALIQSSSATTVMLIGFVNSGLMKLTHSINVIIGANIGTTITSWILSLVSIDSNNIFLTITKPDVFGPILGVVGIGMLLMSKRNRNRDIGRVFIGFFVLIFGMSTMYQAVQPLAEIPAFTNMLTAFSNPLLGLLTGAVFTAIIQSSSASVGIMQALSVTGVISYSGALALVLGANIGTCATALISSIGTNTNAKRTAVIHLYVKTIGALVFMALFYIAHAIFRFDFFANPVRSVDFAIIHTLFNLTTAFILLPFTKWIVRLAELTVKSKGTDVETIVLDERFLNTPTLAVEQCKKHVTDMANLTKATILRAIPLVTRYDMKEATLIRDNEQLVDVYEDKLGSYIVKLSTKALNEKDSKEISKILYSINDFERISDHACNLVDIAEELYDKKISFSVQANKELSVMAAAVMEVVTISIDAYLENDFDLAYRVEPLEQVIDELKLIIKAHHVERLQDGNCTIELGFVLSDLVNSFERVADHCSNIAILTIQTAQGVFDTHKYLHDVKQGDQEKFLPIYREYHDKYDVTDEEVMTRYLNTL